MRVNEIFCSLQGEGFYAGTPAVFIRFSGCNLQCPFCDTTHQTHQPLDEEAIVQQAARFAPRLAILTGGEPALQLTPSLVDRLHAHGFRVHVETNGTYPLPPQVDWITLSPKHLFVGQLALPVLTEVDELKVLFDGEHDPSCPPHVKAQHLFLQPLDTGYPDRNALLCQQAAAYCIEHPQWRLSLQIHKIIHIP